MLLHTLEVPSFLRLNNIPLYAHTTFCLSIHLSVDFWVVLVIVNNAVMNMVVQIFVQVSAFSALGYIPRSRITG